VQLYDRSIGGWDVERHAAEPNDDLPGLVPVEQLRGTLHLTLRVGAGHITVNE
jgi:hypothetical protein